MGGLVTKWTPTKCGPNIAPRRRTLSHSGLLTKCGREFLPPMEDFVTQRTPTKCGL